MKEHDLCRICKKRNYTQCQFDRVAGKIAKRANNNELDLIEALNKIASLRITARINRECKNINNVNPYLTGL